jgi:hypothetical protein
MVVEDNVMTTDWWQLTLSLLAQHHRQSSTLADTTLKGSYLLSLVVYDGKGMTAAAACCHNICTSQTILWWCHSVPFSTQDLSAQRQ